MNPVILILLCIVIANLVIIIAKKVRIPDVVALILLGILFSLPFLRSMFNGANIMLLTVLGDLGLLLLMFIAGLNSSKKKLMSEEKDSFIISVFSTLFPFILTIFAFLILKFSLTVSIIVAVCLSITAEATNAKILLGLNKLKTKIGTVIMEAGIFDDIFGFFIFIMVTIIFKEHVLGDNILLIGVIFSFFLGLYLQRIRHYWYFVYFEKGVQNVIIPFFFISLGIMYQSHYIFIHPLFFLIVISIAIIGKVYGTLLAKPFLKFSSKQLHLIGWAMNSRGAVELALAVTALKIGLINDEIYSSLVIMALVTSMLFPFIVTRIIKKNPRIMSQ